jgi:hypothetical protein
MKQGSRQISSRDSLSEVRRRFERWRKSRRRGTRIPEDLWQAAADVGREIGVSKTAQELHLDYYALRQRTEAVLKANPAREIDPVRETPSEGGFLEIPLCAPPSPECVLEIEHPRGARLRLELKGATPAHLETLARTIWTLAR